MSTLVENRSRSSYWTPPRIAVAVVVALLIAWAYAPSVGMLVGRWSSEQDYVYGFLVIPFSGWLLWARRDLLPEAPFQGSLWGLAFLAVCGVLRVAAAYMQWQLVEPLSLLPCLAGVAVLALGWQGLLWSWPSILYLVFMIPLPGFVAQMLSQPLQEIGANTSTYLLQSFGVPASVHGTVISLSRWELGVEEACSGIRMLMLFLAVCAGAAMAMMQRPAWERIILILSSILIAVIANVIRITVTGILYETTGPEWAEAVFHDLAGWFMMPLAVVLLWMEMLILSLLFPPQPQEDWL